MDRRSYERRIEAVPIHYENARETHRRVGPGTRRGLLGQRRRFLVPGSYQIRTILGVAGLSVLLLAILDITIWRLQAAQSERVLRAAPELTKLILAQDAMQLTLVILASAVGLLAVVAIVLFESHKTAGPLHNLKNTLGRMGEEGTSVRVTFRKDDHFQDLAEAFNGMAEKLTNRSKLCGEKAERVADALRTAAQEIAGGSLDDVGAQQRMRSLASDLDHLKDSLARG